MKPPDATQDRLTQYGAERLTLASSLKRLTGNSKVWLEGRSRLTGACREPGIKKVLGTK